MIIDIYNENNEFVDYDVSVGNCIWVMWIRLVFKM